MLTGQFFSAERLDEQQKHLDSKFVPKINENLSSDVDHVFNVPLGF